MQQQNKKILLIKFFEKKKEAAIIITTTIITSEINFKNKEKIDFFLLDFFSLSLSLARSYSLFISSLFEIFQKLTDDQE